MKKWLKTLLIIAIVISGLLITLTIWSSKQMLSQQALEQYGTKTEVQQYLDSKNTPEKRLYDLIAPKSIKESEAKSAISKLRQKNESAAQKAVDVIYDSDLDRVTSKANKKTFKAAQSAVAKLPQKEQSKYKVALETVKAYITSGGDVEKVVAQVWKDGQLVGNRDQYDAAYKLVEQMRDSDTKTKLLKDLASADAALDLQEGNSTVKTLVTAVYQDGKVVGTRDQYNTALQAVNQMPDSTEKQSLLQTLNTADAILTAQEQTASAQSAAQSAQQMTKDLQQQVQSLQQQLQSAQTQLSQAQTQKADADKQIADLQAQLNSAKQSSSTNQSSANRSSSTPSDTTTYSEENE